MRLVGGPAHIGIAVGGELDVEERELLTPACAPLGDHGREPRAVGRRVGDVGFALIEDAPFDRVAAYGQQHGVVQGGRGDVGGPQVCGFAEPDSGESHQVFAAHPCFDFGAAPCAYDHADGHLLPLVEHAAEEEADGAERFGRFGRRDCPASPAVVSGL